ncbi:hypothetical protein LbDm2_2267 [Levilactobacillus brevis]|uniref:hypothetical protein n=1 Tax=Levilactobacillus brevis TaxID=1580 RepID=UPI00057D62DF|nr:hypothetical protein [Levilactobacillus brevis]KID42051.1 hypothetical protein LbDm2_2498 [Levilactobacillus brevis]KID42843.1 hypothetical protein LbDm2_2267 [Levilactobacillus brevis]
MKLIILFKRYYLWLFLSAIFIIPIILGCLINSPLFNLSNGTNDGWLGFWGGFLAAFISIFGIYWQVQKNINASRESEFKKSRPFVLVSLCPYRNQTREKRVLHLDSLSSYDRLFNSSLDKNDEYVPNKSSYLGPLYLVLKIENVSDKPLYAVKLNFSNCVDSTEICVSRINANSTIYAFPAKLIKRTAYPSLPKMIPTTNRVIAKKLAFETIKLVKDEISKSIGNHTHSKFFPEIMLHKSEKTLKNGKIVKIITNFSEVIYARKIWNAWYKQMRFNNMELYFTSELREIVRLNYEAREKENGHLIPILCYDRDNSYVENKDKDTKKVNYDVDGFKESEVDVQEWTN